MVPEELKRALQMLVDDWHISMSAMLRLIMSEYVKRR
jgi:hypothetical protein